MRMLVQFCGDDLPPRVYTGPRRIHHPDAASLFRLGKDTASIASLIETTEAKVLKRVTLERCERLGLANPYEAEQ